MSEFRLGLLIVGVYLMATFVALIFLVWIARRLKQRDARELELVLKQYQVLCDRNLRH